MESVAIPEAVLQGSFWMVSGSRGLEQKVISASWRMNFARATNSAIYEFYSQNVPIIFIEIHIILLCFCSEVYCMGIALFIQ